MCFLIFVLKVGYFFFTITIINVEVWFLSLYNPTAQSTHKNIPQKLISRHIFLANKLAKIVKMPMQFGWCKNMYSRYMSFLIEIVNFKFFEWNLIRASFFFDKILISDHFGTMIVIFGQKLISSFVTKNHSK